MAVALDDDARDERLWLARLRWRLRGAWQWPMFGVFTIADALVLHWLPFSGGESDAIAAFLVCGFLNLGIVGAAGPVVGRALRARRPHLPQQVAADRASVMGMGALFAVFLAFGIAHHGAVSDAGADRTQAVTATREFARAHAPERFRPGIGRESVLDTGAQLYRVCLAGPDRRRNWCVYVDTAGDDARVRLDADQRPNSVVAGPDNPGRQGG